MVDFECASNFPHVGRRQFTQRIDQPFKQLMHNDMLGFAPVGDSPETSPCAAMAGRLPRPPIE